MARDYELDDIDRKILALLIADAKMPYTEIARKSTCRVARCTCAWPAWKNWALYWVLPYALIIRSWAME